MDSHFELIQEDGRARLGRWHLPHGVIQTPAFMPVGTKGSVKTLAPWEAKDLSEGIILSNTYHLITRPGTKLIKQMGGLHRWIGWDGNILTDSGGFQVMSLASLRKVTEDGVAFQSHIDGQKIFLNPENVVDAQVDLGSDVMMVLDECTSYPVGEAEARSSMELSMRWARRAWDYWVQKAEFQSHSQLEKRSMLLGIQQGGMFPQLRKQSADMLKEIPMDGYAIGGLSVGEPKNQMLEMMDVSTSELPSGKIRYLMGVGKPEDLVEAVHYGVDVFDCVLPTRNARNGSVFLSREGHANITNKRFREETGPIDPLCRCRCCQYFSASFVQHLFKAGELLSLRLMTEHNLWYLKTLLQNIRDAIQGHRFQALRSAFKVNLGTTSELK